MPTTRTIGKHFLRVSPLVLVATMVMWQTGSTAGTLTGSMTTGSTSNVNLSAAGITQWAVWGQGTSTSLAPTSNSIGMTGISNLTGFSNGNSLRGLGQYGSYGESTFTWTNGTPTLSASGVASGIQFNNQPGGPSGVGEGFSFTVPANTIAAQLTLFTTTHDGISQLLATLSDGSAPPLTINTTQIGNNKAHTFYINYQANSNATLTLKYLLTSENSGYGNAAIQGVSTTYTVPGPLPVLGVASAFGMSRRLRRRIACTQSSL